MRASYEFARVQLTRFRPVRGVLRTASTDSIVLLQLRRKRWHLENNQPDLWSEVGWLRKSFVLAGHPHPKGTSYGDAEASPSGRSTQRQGDKRQRTPRVFASRHRSRLNRVKRTIARW